MNELNKLAREIMGKTMTKTQRYLLYRLRQRVKAKEITVQEAHDIWNKKLKELQT